ncbi:hypothetical protein J4Q44_G00182060 [Coregonus suidteri]|uniref:Septin-type G domain-containing protein n=1 Tax=Coregonus suidteri TaxID=861788 RepID=A0AAN8LHN7_9TELE
MWTSLLRSPPSSPVPSPLSSTSLLNKTNEGRGFPTSNHSSPAFRSRISLGTNPSPSQSPVFKSRMVSSLSFNRAMNRPTINNNGGSSGGITRASSFQNKFNPKGFSSSLSGPGSDNDSLHSSSSSLEYSIQGGGGEGGGLPPGKSGSLSYSTTPQMEQRPGQQPGAGLGMGIGLGSPALKKVSSHGSVFHSELEGPMVLGAPEPRGVSHGSMPSLDLQIGEGGGRVMRGAGGGGVRYGNANVGLNGGSQRHYNTSSFGKEGCYSPNQNHNIYQPQSQPKPKETQRLNKFPLDLDSLVGVKTPQPSPHPPPSSDPPKPPPRGHYPSSLDSSGGDLTPLPPANRQQHNNPSLPRSPPPTSPPGAKPVPKVSQSPVPLSPAQTPQLNLLSPRPQVGHLAPSIPSTPPPLEHAQPPLGHAQPQEMMSERESVGSILQRIASFSRPDAMTTTRVPSAASVLSGVALSNGVKKESPPPMRMMRQERVSSASPSPLPVAVQRQGLKRVQDTTKVLEQEKPASMEERGMEEEEVKAAEDKPAEEKEEGVAEEKREMEEREMEREVDIERKMEVEVEVANPCPTESQGLHGLQGTIKGHDLFGYVGIEAVLDQMRRKTMKAGFEFNIMVVGQSGLGKSTLVNTKQCISLLSFSYRSQSGLGKSTLVNTKQCISLLSFSCSGSPTVIEEKGVKMKLTVIDTPGFGDQINNENWKRRIPDTRVHCCVYFLPATGHWLRPIDVEFMKRLGKIVSIVPVIAKADTLTMEERLEFKQRIRQDLKANGIRVYPQTEYDEDPEDRILNDKIRENIPFAVVGTDKEHQVNGNKVLGRKTKWGIIEVENVAHCEFANLRDLLIRSHLQDLKDVTHNIHYETFRVRRLNESNLTVHGLALSCFPMENGTHGTNGTNGTNGTSDRSESESQL